MTRGLLILLVTALWLGLYPLCGCAATQAVSGQGFVADYYPAKAHHARYGVLVLGGAEGGIPTELAAAIATKGYSVLALAYFRATGLPPELENIPLEYFDKPKAWLLAHAKAANAGIADGLIIVGWSKGAELALLLAANDPHVKAVVAISPSDVVWPGILKDWRKVPGSSWTRQGKPLPYVPFVHGVDVRSLLDLYTHSLAQTDAVARARLPVENIAAPVLLLSGSKDQVWPANAMADADCQRMIDRHSKGVCIHRNYSDVGHLLDERFLPSAGDARKPMHPSQAVFFGFLDAVEHGKVVPIR